MVHLADRRGACRELKPLELTKVKKGGWRFRSAHRNLNISKGNRPLRKEGFESVAKDHLVTQAQRGDPAGRWRWGPG